MPAPEVEPGAIDAAFAEGDLEGAAALIERAGQHVFGSALRLPLDRLEVWLDRLRDRVEERPWLLYHQSMVWNTQRRLALAGAALARSERLFMAMPEDASTRRGLAMVKMARGIVAERSGNFALAHQHFAEARALLPAARAPQPWLTAEDVARWREHDPSGAAAFYSEAIPALRAAGEALPLARGLTNFAHELLRRGEPAIARHAALEAVELKRGTDSEAALANSLNTLGAAETQLGMYDNARRTLAESAELAERSTNRLIHSYALNNLAEVERDAGDVDAAVSLYARAHALKEQLGDGFGLSYGLRSNATLARRTGDLANASALLDRAVSLREPVSDPYEGAQLRLEQGLLDLAYGRTERARAAFREVRLLAGETDAKALDVLARLGLAAVGDRGGDAAGALEVARRHHTDRWLAPELLFLERAAPRLRLPGGPRMYAAVLGEFSLTIDGVRVEIGRWRSKRAAELVRILVARRHAPAHRDELIEWLWPDASDAGPELNTAVNAARRAFEQVGGVLDWIVREGDRYYLSHLGAIDADELLAAYGEARRAIDAGQPLRAASVLRDRLARVAGEPYETDRYAEWCAAERAELTEVIQLGRETLARLAIDLGRPDEAILHTVAAIAREPSRESSYQLLIRAHLARGDRASALRALAACRDALRREFGVEPGPATESLLPATDAPAEVRDPSRA